MAEAKPVTADQKRDVAGLGIPAGACDCHVHVFEPALFPLADGRAYTPGRASLAMLEAHLDGLGIDRVVLVQASVYGTDNACLLDALTRLRGRGRAVAVIDPGATSAADLRALWAAGVRGVRVNLESKGETRVEAALDAFAATAGRVAGHGFAVQIYADMALLPGLAETIAASPSPVILDHFAGAKAERGPSQPGFAELIDLLATGKVWVKLSALYRASALAGSADLEPIARAMIQARPDRMVWASDWPHTGGGKDRAARGPLTVEPFREIDSAAALRTLKSWCGDDAAFHRILAANAARLFDFPS
ncbi:amidohydrolase family protein [Aquabacter cavernae]|uniref:amidohydrolase family protein n=1 Tax=Aquabacter cavernae TaxID=2496029 RepID=UPI0013E0D504|nr:amidohydrolase family protein [Aquabacter cavernae]